VLIGRRTLPLRSILRDSAWFTKPITLSSGVTGLCMCAILFTSLIFSCSSLFFNNRVVLLYAVNCYVCSITNGQLKLEDTALTKSVLENTKCFLLDCGAELFVWVGRVTQVEERKAASAAVEVKLQPNFIVCCLVQNISYLKFTSCRNSLLKKIDQRQQE